MSQRLVYNVSLLIGWLMIGAGITTISIAAALVVCGTLLIVLTIAAALVPRLGR